MTADHAGSSELNSSTVSATPDSDPVPSAVPETADILGQLRARVAERVAAGQYPADLPESMQAHFFRLTRNRPPNPDGARAVEEAVKNAREASRFAVERIPIESDSRYGEYAHKALRKMFFRQAQGIIEQVQPSADRVNDAIETLALRVRELDEGFSREVRGLDERWGVHLQRQRRADARIDDLEQGHSEQRARLDAERVAERAELQALRADVEHLAATVAELRAATTEIADGLKAVQRIEADRSFQPWYDNDAFEARFRGTRAEIIERYRDLAKHFDGCGPVADLGCGRGEMLEILAHMGVESYGVEIDGELVKGVQQLKLRAMVGEARSHLMSLPDESLGGICMIQVVEHLTQQGLVDVLALAFRKLRPGGRIVMETVNAKSLYVYAHSFYLDPTHTRPVHPEYLHFLCDQAGFTTVDLEYRSDLAVEDRLGAMPKGAVGARLMNDNVERLNHLLFTPLDYAVIATK